MPRVFLSIQLVHGLKAKMKNKLMPMWDKIMLRKRYTIECINELLKNKANLVHSRHRSIHNFIMNLCSALTAYCFFDNKPEALPVYVEKSKLLELFAYCSYSELKYKTNLIVAWHSLLYTLNKNQLDYAKMACRVLLLYDS